MSDSSIAPIGLKIIADMGEFGAPLKKGGDDLDAFTSRSKASLGVLSSSFSSATSSASSFFSSFGRSGLDGAFSQASSQLSGFMSQLSAGAGPWGAFAAAGVAAVTAIGTAASRTAGQIGDLNKLSRTLGTSNTDTQVVQTVFRQSGMDDESSRATALRFSARLGAASLDADSLEAKAFQRIGLDPSALSQRTLPNSLEQTFQQLRGITNRPQQDAAARDIFGRGFSELEGAIQRPNAFPLARNEIAVGGITDSQSDQVKRTTVYRRETQDRLNASGGTFAQRLNRDWNDFGTYFDQASARHERSHLGLGLITGTAATLATGGLFDTIAGLLTPTSVTRPTAAGTQSGGVLAPTSHAIPIDAYIAPWQQGRADAAAEKLAQTWQDEASLFTRSAAAATALRRTGIDTPTASEIRRSGEIMRSDRDPDVTPTSVSALRAQNEILSNLERRSQIESDLVGITLSTRTSYERYQATLTNTDRLQASMLTDEGPDAFGALDATNRARAQAFMTARSVLGHGPSSYAIDGIDSRTMAGARFQADRDVRAKLPDRDSEDGVRSDSEAMRDFYRQELERQDRIIKALDKIGNGGPLMPAPNS